MTMLADAEPQLHQTEVLTPVPEVLSIGEQQFFVYNMPPTDPNKSTSVPDILATTAPEILERVLNEGIGSLGDGEGFLVAGISRFNVNVDVTGFKRVGDGLNIYSRQGDEITARNPLTDAREPLHVESGNVEAYFLQDLAVITASRGLGLAELGGRLGKAVADLGFVSEDLDSPVPLPETLGDNINVAREAGIMIPVVKFSKEAQIDSEPYVDAWSDEEFPASEQPTYSVHDLLQEHFAPLVVFREDAMIIGSLYARSVKETEEITAVVSGEYGILHTRQLSGRKKFKHAADCLDNFTNDLSDVSREIEDDVNDPEIQARFSEHPEGGWRRIPQMVQAILASSHRQEFIDHLESIGSNALNQETDEFSYETYMKEIFVRAQDFWEITPDRSGRTQERIGQIATRPTI